MAQTDRPPPFFIADDPALDFLNSICQPADQQFEWLANGKDLVDWLARAELISKAEAVRCADFAKKDLDAAAEEARSLREALRRELEAGAGLQSPRFSGAIVERLNTLLRRSPQHLNLEQNNAPPPTYALKRERRLTAPADLLSPLAEAAARMIAAADFAAIKQCEGPTCTLWFRDVSKNRKRRWCVMSICGNRAKAAAFRQRRREEG